MNLNQAFSKYIHSRRDLREGSIRAYTNAYKRVEGIIGDRELSDIKYSDIKELYLSLLYDYDFSASSIELVNSILHPIFETAVRDELINKNPCAGILKEVSRSDSWIKEGRNALSAHDQERFMNYVNFNPVYHKWYSLFTFLLGTGCRIGEAVGLYWEDVNFEEEYISINHGLYYEGSETKIGKLKTPSSNRLIPMLPEVKDALTQAMLYEKTQFAPMEDLVPGEKGFVFLNSLCHPHIPATVNQAIRNIINSYNSSHPEEPLKSFSAHTFRHTFCTRLCENEVNVKVIQSIMGHSDIQTTMNIYVDLSEKKKKIALQRLEGKVLL